MQKTSSKRGYWAAVHKQVNFGSAGRIWSFYASVESAPENGSLSLVIHSIGCGIQAFDFNFSLRTAFIDHLAVQDRGVYRGAINVSYFYLEQIPVKHNEIGVLAHSY